MSVAPYDEGDISPDDCIIRRINPEQHVVWDDNLDKRRVSSKAFTPSSGTDGGMSVDIENKIIGANEDPKEYVTTPVFTGSVHFLASAIRELDLWIGYDPLPDNPHHGEVWGNPRPNRFKSSQKNGLHRLAQWYVALENVDLR